MLDLETTEHMLRIYNDYGMIFFGLSAISLVLIAVQHAISRRAMTPGGLPERVTTLIVMWFMAICGLAVLFLSATVMILWLNKSHLTNHAQLISRMSNPAFLPSALVLGALFYRLKRDSPSLYGIVELLAATFAIWAAVLIQTDNLFAKIFALLGGIYILVGALENINKGVPNIFEPVWSKFFGPSERATQITH
jgi:hypothetical protein